jgi:hypothetical protein
MTKKYLLLSFCILVICVLIQPVTISAQSSIQVSVDQIVSYFPDKLIFQLTASSSSEIQSIKLLYRTNGATCQTAVAQQIVDFTPAKSVDTEWEWDFTLTGILPLGAEVYWQWSITTEDESSLLTDEESYQVIDPRHNWKQLTNGQVTLQWYDGDQSFGQSLMNIADQSLTRLANDAGVNPSGQIWITIYPTVSELLEVDIHTSEWAGGIAYPEYNSTIMAIGNDELDWAASVIPHELAHLVTDSVMFNCRGMWLPTWLSEGLAVYAEGNMPSYYTEIITNALEKGNLPPLRTLERGFSSNASEADRSYAHSGILVSFLIEQYGAKKMSGLLSSIKSGLMIDKALLAVYGKDTDGLEAEWRISLGYAPQPTQFPTSASRTRVPTLALWTSVVRPTLTPTPQPTTNPTTLLASDTPGPLPSFTLSSPVDDVVAEDVEQNPGSSTPLLIGIAVVVVLLATVLLVILVIVPRRRRRSP